MVDAVYKTDFSGRVTEMTNMVPLAEGGIRTVLPEMNAVVTQFIPGQPDEDGNPTYIPMTSIICKDEHMKEMLLVEARRIIESR